MKFNDLNINNWKELDINVDSLWLIEERYKSGKHSNIYHGNFIPQIPYQLIKRYIKENEIVLDTFLGSGTTMYVAEELNRYCIGFDINNDILNFVKQQMNDLYSSKYFIKECDSSNKLLFNEKIQEALKHKIQGEKSYKVSCHVILLFN